MNIPEFKEKDQLHKFLKDNLSVLTAEKRIQFKKADAISFLYPVYDHKIKSFKADISPEELLNKDDLTVKLAINSTNIMDSHMDVHMPGLWKKSLKESSSRLLHLQEHDMSFKGVIADALDGEIKAYTELMSWKELGIDFKGSTEVFLFDSIVKKLRNPYMFEQYAKRFVKNHSVGMHYVKMFMCINSEEKYYREEKEYWDQYYPEVINKDRADECGYFWAVTEARAIEGSAVPRGSNYATPTLDMKGEPGDHSSKLEPVVTTQKTLNYLTENFKLN